MKNDDDEDDVISLAILKAEALDYNLYSSFNDYISIDEHLVTAETLTDEDIIETCRMKVTMNLLIL